ncbi:MAG: hemolysin III family protein [Chloracidobacterium sp.]|nr:hemolysin III family protein [Chloracidobacterium sp.]
MIKAHLNSLSVEELANTITHGFGLVLSIIGFVVLVILAGVRGDAISFIGCSVYGLSLVILYAASTIYHATIMEGRKKKMQIADHCGIYLLIAGSYTPFVLVVMKGPFGQNLLTLIWGLAIAGIVAKLLMRDRWPAVSVVSYLVLGWIGIVVIQPLLAALGSTAIALVIAGGAAYSLGVIFFAWNRIPHNHAIFHVFILAGSILHYIAVVVYVVPYSANL